MIEWKIGDRAIFFNPEFPPSLEVEIIRQEFTDVWLCSFVSDNGAIKYIWSPVSLLSRRIPTLSERQAALSEKAKRLRAARDLEPESIERDAAVEYNESCKDGATWNEVTGWYLLRTGEYPKFRGPTPEELEEINARLSRLKPIDWDEIMRPCSILSNLKPASEKP